MSDITLKLNLLLFIENCSLFNATVTLHIEVPMYINNFKYLNEKLKCVH